MSLTANYTFVGKGNWSIDAAGGQVGGANDTISAIVPEGSKIEAAFLYGTTFGGGGDVNAVTLTIGGVSTVISGFEGLGATSGFPLQAYRADVTSYISTTIGDGDDDTFNFVRSNINGSSVDGFALVIVYSNPDESTRTISLLDGFSEFDGDEFELTFSEPVDTTQEGFEAQFSLGVGFGFWPSDQFSRVTVDGRQLTQSAGAQDDGSTDFSSISNGGLITIGGIGDSTANPDPDQPIDGVRTDDELYDLAQGNVDNPAPYLANGATGITVTTLNPSNDDNIFFAGLNVTAVVSVDTDENDAPVAVGDAVSVGEDDAVTFDVLGNDFDPDAADEFTITSFDTTGLVGMLSDDGDGNFTYDPDGEFDDLDDGENATTSFTYTISDGEESATTTVTITVVGSDDDDGPPPEPSDCPTVDRAGTQDGSSSSDQVLTGPAYHNTFYFDNGGDVGDDRITNFAADDILVTDLALRDANGDGFIGFGGGGILNLSGSSGGTVVVEGIRSLRFLGEACEDNWVYGAAYVRPDEAIEGFVLTDDALAGDAGDAATDVFFFDTALDLDLGADSIANFGSNDVLVTTTRIADSNNDGIIGFGADRMLDLPGGVGGPGDPGLAGDGGMVGLTDLAGVALKSLEYDGSVTQNGVTYYVYSAIGSAAGVDALG
jgi:VCBS repeat-containing protein